MAYPSLGDAARGNLRALIATIDRELTLLPAASDGERARTALQASWTELVSLLALEPPAETRLCPVCHGSGMRAASRCMHCWAKLEPLAALAPEAPRSHA